MVTESTLFDDRVVETFKVCQQRNDSPVIWRMEISKCVREAGLGFPSPELGQILVSNLCFSNNNPSLWKFVEQAVSSGLVSPLHVLALLTSRVVPRRWTEPEAYRLYLELLSQYLFTPTLVEVDSCKKKNVKELLTNWKTRNLDGRSKVLWRFLPFVVIWAIWLERNARKFEGKEKSRSSAILKSVDDALEFSLVYGVPVLELGQAMVLFLFTLIVGLLDSTLNDWGLQVSSFEKLCGTFGSGDQEDMDINYKGNSNGHRNEHREELRRANPFTAMDVLGKLTESKKAMVLIRLVHLNMPEKFNGLLQRLQFVEANKLVSSNLKAAHHLLARLSSNVTRALGLEYQLNKRQLIGMLINIGSFSSASSCNFGAGRAACWIPFDIYMETSMDGKHIPASSAVDVLTELTKTLQVINQASWQETFQALWISALRLVQRGREPLEGPIPHIDARLCILLSITPLAIVHIVENEEDYVSGKIGAGSESKMGEMISSSQKNGLISSLQALGQFSGLLYPPASLVVTANNAAAKAANFVANLKNGNDGFNRSSRSDTYLKAGGNMLHLIVEACIARKLIDTSVYSWPGYVSASVTSPSDPSLIQGSAWSTFMEGAKLAGPLKNSLMSTPGPSLVEIEKLYHIALNGREEDRSAAAKVLCGASLSRGWNIQVHMHLVLFPDELVLELWFE
ncbi:hypothetical protein GIB67_041991 [Kingdonia uniflora]|uniref:Mediator of RNA polymerase II transcription subunit 33A n=1 Tax=Kingdonia uniflora TaxID=39325 RepID=A0A7J7P0G8_9MAGN|nr:hypothetical protein GIB67_041991 [Kingdonia uniflora]